MYERGEGSNLFDVDGNRYVDLTAGFGALILGHAPNEATRAAAEATERLPLALGDVFASESKVRACEALASLFPEPGARVLLGLSGADAVTAALKTVALADPRPQIIAFEGSYHGLSHGPLAALGFAPGFRSPFAAQTGDFVRFVPYPRRAEELEACLAAVERLLGGGAVGAVLVEPVLGRGGCLVPPTGFLAGLRRLTQEHRALLVTDEIWSGMGRTGKVFAADHEGVVPDVVCLGKGLGGGVPISACIGRASVMEAWGAHGGTAIHTGTHFGSPPACAAALATLARLPELREHARRVGDVALKKLGALGKAPVRGRGLMIGVDLGSGARALAVSRALLQRGYVVLTGGEGGGALTLSPALTIEEELIEGFVETLGAVLELPETAP